MRNSWLLCLWPLTGKWKPTTPTKTCTRDDTSINFRRGILHGYTLWIWSGNVLQPILGTSSFRPFPQESYFQLFNAFALTTGSIDNHQRMEAHISCDSTSDIQVPATDLTVELCRMSSTKKYFSMSSGLSKFQIVRDTAIFNVPHSCEEKTCAGDLEKCGYNHISIHGRVWDWISRYGVWYEQSLAVARAPA